MAINFELNPQDILPLHDYERGAREPVMLEDYMAEDTFVLQALQDEAIEHGDWDKATEYHHQLS